MDYQKNIDQTTEQTECMPLPCFQLFNYRTFPDKRSVILVEIF